jgi:hypothetical protein
MEDLLDHTHCINRSYIEDNILLSKIKIITDKFQINQKSPGIHILKDIVNNIIKSTKIPNCNFIFSESYIKYISDDEFVSIITNCHNENGQICRNILTSGFINNFINYEKNKISWLFYDNIIWAKTEDIVKLLEYKNIKKCNYVVNRKNRITLGKIFKNECTDYYEKYKSLPLDTDFINEFGIYQMIIKSKKKGCKNFILSSTYQIISSILNTGKFDIHEKNIIA